MQTSTFNHYIDDTNDSMQLSLLEEHPSSTISIKGRRNNLISSENDQSDEEEKDEFVEMYSTDDIMYASPDKGSISIVPDLKEDEVEERLKKLEIIGSSSKINISKSTSLSATSSSIGANKESTSHSSAKDDKLSSPFTMATSESSNSKLLTRKDIQRIDNEEEEEYLQNQQQQQTKQQQKQRQGNPMRDTFFAEFNEKLNVIGFSTIPLNIIELTQYPLSPLERILIETVNQGIVKIRELGDTINELVSEAEQNENKEQIIAEQIDMENKKLEGMQNKIEDLQTRNEELENMLILSQNESVIEVEKAKKEIRQLKKDFDDLEDKSRKIVKENKRLNAVIEQQKTKIIFSSANEAEDDHLNIEDVHHRRKNTSSSEQRKQIVFDEHEYELVLASNEALEQQAKDLEDQLRMSKAEIKKLSGFLKEFMDHNEKQLVHLPQIQTALEEKDREIEKLKAELGSRPPREEWVKAKANMDHLNLKLQNALEQINARAKALEFSNPPRMQMDSPSKSSISSRKVSDSDRDFNVDEELYILDEACKLLSLKNSRNLIGELKRVILKARALARVKVFVNEICELVITNSDHPFSSDISITDPTISPEVLARVIPQIRAWIPRRR